MIYSKQLEKLLLNMFHFFKNVTDDNKKKLTVMVIPHNENGIKNLHIAHFWIYLTALILIVSLLLATFFLTKLTIHSKELMRLTKFRETYQLNLSLYQKEIETYQEGLKAFSKGVTAITESSQAKKAIAFGVGGREVDLEKLSIELKEFLKKQEAGEADPWSTLGDNREYFRYANSMTKELGNFIKERKKFLLSLPTLWPVQDGQGAILTTSDIENNGQPNSLMLDVIAGSSVVASGEGTIVQVKLDPKDLFSVIVDHGLGIQSEYHHLTSIEVQEEESLKKGTRIGYSSKKLIFKIKIASKYIDPSTLAVSRFN